ncbi:energy-coupling factor transporter ATPase [Finegoldia magna]|uniref:Energy-coupling factor transporter ATPase n=1 Tax=Finegoldia magna TaxID=1260 RepID=A0A233UYK4_FINMA|nr:energy-coupling factor transporter ATPase [Finegoldia magna]MBS5964763.1 energy-coupling factor transporter ATPase [Finegoldia magna]MDU1398808.1 energy-coupling factor transporter ATPase [Finegoldia magna]MDU5223163.1 energy-coupling factor transporter ATPase [Finegoldia magna]MDU5236527.1 energy-coupling factor transporter ATPase [Finegoldia magna]MDU5369235.1 energy-coupling factor transporter ATPase [Finegoldia magna]
MKKDTNIIEIKNLSFQYEGSSKKVLKNLNIDIKEGEFICVLGHNGSGKSTLAKLINAQYIPTEGDILVGNMNTKDDDNLWNIREMCGMVFQNPDNQLVATIVEEDVAFGPENLGVPREELRKRVDECLELVGMSEYKRHSPALLSGGQKQRIAIAGILAMNPKCLLMDEPTAMLDPQGRKDILDTVLKLREMGKTIIHITHYMEECVNADRIIVINEGNVVLEGTPREVFSNVVQMKEIGLDVPEPTEISYLLNKSNINVRADVLTVDELVEALEGVR